jgi:hypothetical protein
LLLWVRGLLLLLAPAATRSAGLLLLLLLLLRWVGSAAVGRIAAAAAALLRLLWVGGTTRLAAARLWRMLLLVPAATRSAGLLLLPLGRIATVRRLLLPLGSRVRPAGWAGSRRLPRRLRRCGIARLGHISPAAGALLRLRLRRSALGRIAAALLARVPRWLLLMRLLRVAAALLARRWLLLAGIWRASLRLRRLRLLRLGWVGGRGRATAGAVPGLLLLCRRLRPGRARGRLLAGSRVAAAAASRVTWVVGRCLHFRWGASRGGGEKPGST